MNYNESRAFINGVLTGWAFSGIVGIAALLAIGVGYAIFAILRAVFS